jgi:hypothetical protein
VRSSPPRLIFHEPDDQPPEWRPVLHVLQDGRVELDGATVFHPRKLDGGKVLREALERLAQTARAKVGSKKFGTKQTELVEAHLLIHADQWAPWSSVRQVMQVAVEVRPAFYRLEFAAAQQDFEELFAKSHGFPETRSGAGQKRDKR